MSVMTCPIQLESVSKCYRIYQNPQDRFKQALLERFMSATGRENTHALYREHWALCDISFELKAGEAVGILGRNGAGKSTLLQIIAGTLQPTSGVVNTHGRITALLELGSGFNPEFTGRENVLLNAQILGLSREEALARFDEIASFADIGDFIDQPVKTYSSGMMMRLAFSVQTALSPSVLIVDEALAVGDIFFQAKCMNRLRQMREDGTSILFVSHATNTIKELCERAILLDKGYLLSDGKPNDVVHKYLELVATNKLPNSNNELREVSPDIESDIDYHAAESSGLEQLIFLGKRVFDKNAVDGRLGNKKAEFINLVLIDVAGKESNTFSFGDDVTCLMVIKINDDVTNLWIGYKLRTVTGIDIIHADSSLYDQLEYPFKKGKSYIVSWKFTMSLMHGAYTVGCAIGLPDPPRGIGRIMEYVDVINTAQTFTVAPREEGMIGGTAVWENNLNIQELG